jgi:hypothetical protein
VAEKVHVFGSDGVVREIALGRVTNFVGGGLDLVCSIGVGSSFLGGGLRDGCFRGCGSLLHGGLGTTEATFSVTGAMLACDCWRNWWDD